MMETLRYHFSRVGSFWRGGLRRRTAVMAAVLVLSALMGYLMCAANPEVTNALIEYFMSAMLDSGVISAEGTISALDLLLNNWVALLLCVAYGFLPFLFLPVVILFSNAYLIGVMGAYYHINGFPMGAFLAGIAPHGIFELSALAVAAAMGFSICLALVKKILHAPGAPLMRDLAGDVLRTLLLVIFPLLVLSAVIEAFVTPRVMSLFL